VKCLPTQEILECPDLWAAPGIPFLPAGEGRAQLATYLDMLASWNKVLNLSGCHDVVSLLRDLVQDSFFLARFLEDVFQSKNWTSPQTLDLGAGAGLPGIPLRIFWRDGDFAMIERRQKRSLFLGNVLARLKLPRTSVHCCEARDFLASHKPAQCILSRAFMPWRAMLSFCCRHLAKNGIVVFMANSNPPGLDPDWRLLASLEYSLPQKRHWLWAISPRDPQ